MSEFFISFKAVGLRTLEIFIIGFFGFFIVHKGILGDYCLTTLSRLIVNLTMPCLIFSSVITRFNIVDYPDWWIYPLCAVLLLGFGLVIGFYTAKAQNFKFQKEFASIVGFNNSSFLPLPLVAVLFPQYQAERYFVYIFLFTLGFTPLIASVGVLLITGKKFSKETFKTALSPPFYTIIVSLFLASMGVGKYVPKTILSPVRMLGNCTVPLAMIVLGGVIYTNIKNRVKINKRVITEAAFLKLLLLPLIVFFIVKNINLSKDLSFLLVLEACMPPAISLVTFSKNYGGNVAFISQSVFYLYLISIVTIPFWLGLLISIRATLG